MSAATNSTGEYLKLHAEIETESARSSVGFPEVSRIHREIGGTAATDPPQSSGMTPAPEIRSLPVAGGSSTPFDAAVDEVIRDAPIGTDDLAADIARLCGWLSTPEREVLCHIRCINGKPVVYLVREPQPQGLEALLRIGSDVALLRRQAE